VRIVEVDSAGDFTFSRERQNAACDAFQDIVGIPRSYDTSFNTDLRRRIDKTRPIVRNIFKARRSFLCGWNPRRRHDPPHGGIA
jgi:hypothetical protein